MNCNSRWNHFSMQISPNFRDGMESESRGGQMGSMQSKVKGGGRSGSGKCEHLPKMRSYVGPIDT